MTGSEWDEIVTGYEQMLGHTPSHVGLKQSLHVPGSDSERTMLIIERARAAALEPNELSADTVQLVQFAICAALRMGDGARIHAAAALHQGASVEELIGAARVAWVVAGNAALNTALGGIAASIGES